MFKFLKPEVIYVDKPAKIELPRMFTYSIAGVFLTNLLILVVMLLSINSGQDLNNTILPELFSRLDRIESKVSNE